MTGNIYYFAPRETTTTSGESASTAAAATPAVAENNKAAARALIVERVCQGDREAFDELYKMFAPMVHGIILARVPRDEVDDIAQNVFLTAYKNLHNLRDKAAVGAWLAMIARNHSTEYYRQVKPTEELSEDLSQKECLRTEAGEILEKIRRLPEAYRETLILRLVEGMTGSEIAEQTGLTPESVRVNLHRGMKLLRERLGIRD